MSRPITMRTSAILAALMRGIGTELVRARFDLTGDDLAAITKRHRALIASGSLFALERRTERPVHLRLPETTAIEQRQPRPAAAPGVPPLPLRAQQLFSKHTPWEEFERLRVDTGGGVLVPGGALITNGDRAWRCEVSL